MSIALTVVLVPNRHDHLGMSNSFFWGLNLKPTEQSRDAAVWYQTGVPTQLILTGASLLGEFALRCWRDGLAR